jgi:hypothetical protein
MDYIKNRQIVNALNRVYFKDVGKLNFDELVGYMMKPSNIKTYKKILKLLGLSCNYSTKKFMCIFMFKYHENEVINEKENMVKNDIINHANSIIKYFNKLMLSDCFQGLYRFLICHHIDQYYEKYDLWQRVDKLFLIKELYQKYIHYEKFLSDTKDIKPEIKENAIQMQSKIMGKLLTLTNGQFKLNEELNEAYLEVFSYELEHSNFTKLYETLEYIKTLLKSLIPNRVDIHVDIDERIDIEWIKQLFENNAYDNIFIVGLINYLFEKLQEFQARSEDDSTQQWKDAVFKQIYENETFSKFIPHFLELYINKLKQIFVSINNLKNLMDNQ